MAEAQTKMSAGRTGLRIALFLLLGFMLLAVAQDRLRARPKVEAAYDQVEELATAINAAAVTKVQRATTSREVHEALGLEPSRVIQDGPYTIEVYSWRAGLPWRTHDYYVAYVPDRTGERLFMTSHYKYVLDRDSLQHATKVSTSEEEEAEAEMVELTVEESG